jgi:hypothetical protein
MNFGLFSKAAPRVLNYNDNKYTDGEGSEQLFRTYHLKVQSAKVRGKSVPNKLKLEGLYPFDNNLGGVAEAFDFRTYPSNHPPRFKTADRFKLSDIQHGTQHR